MGKLTNLSIEENEKWEIDWAKWDAASANEICFHCAKSSGAVDPAGNVCPWVKNFELLPGTIALSSDTGTKIFRCPGFQFDNDGKLMTETEYTEMIAASLLEKEHRIKSLKKEITRLNKQISTIAGHISSVIDFAKNSRGL